MESVEENIKDIAGVRVICSFPEDIYMLADCLLNQDDIKLIEKKDYIKNYEFFDEFDNIMGIKFTKIPISHDKKGFGFVFEYDNKSLVYMTDTGMIHSRYHEKLKNKTVYLLESNHDVEMEMNGKKFEYIKYRNIGDEGHLSNEDCAMYLNHFIGPDTKDIMLVHISENDNTYEKAYEANRERIDPNIPIYIAYKDKISEVIEV